MAVPGTVTRPDGVVLAYEDSGGDGPVIVLTHGFLDQPAAFNQAVVEFLAGLGERA